MTWAIDSITFDAPTAGVRPGAGYDARPAGTVVSAILLHTTNGARASQFGREAQYLRDSPLVKAHYLVGQDGRIARILDPVWRAWHAGESAWQGHGALNDWSIGIECHHAIGDTWPAAQLAALGWLCAQLVRDHAELRWLLCHREVALPPGRKVDPSDLSADAVRILAGALGLQSG
jgi:N-acetylmuramoyl-L-alanine amidase